MKRHGNSDYAQNGLHSPASVDQRISVSEAPPAPLQLQPAAPSATTVAPTRRETPRIDIAVVAGPLRTAFSADLAASASSPTTALWQQPSPSTELQPLPVAARRRVSFAASVPPLLPGQDSIGAIRSGGGDLRSLKETALYDSEAGREIHGDAEPSIKSLKRCQTGAVKRNSVMPLPHGVSRPSAGFLKRMPTRKASPPTCRASRGSVTGSQKFVAS